MHFTSLCPDYKLCLSTQCLTNYGLLMTSPVITSLLLLTPACKNNIYHVFLSLRQSFSDDFQVEKMNTSCLCQTDLSLVTHMISIRCSCLCASFIKFHTFLHRQVATGWVCKVKITLLSLGGMRASVSKL